jgi:peptidoglycan/xylan/chitin deacetylase (PgdA/CDA1 family)
MRRGYRALVAVVRPQLWIMVIAALFCAGLILPFQHSSHTLAQVWSPNVVSQLTVKAQPPPLLEGDDSTYVPVNCGVIPCLALTFDDGPNPNTTPIVLNALEQAHAHATFFVVGSRAITMPSILQRMYQDGDEIGDHSWTHPDMTTLSPADVVSQIAMTQAAVTDAGVPAPTLFRPPYGAINSVMQSQIHLPFILWNDDPKDWQTLSTPAVISASEAQAKPGAIIDLHDIYESTSEAMPLLIQELQAHYQLVTISQLLNLKPGEQGIFYGG